MGPTCKLTHSTLSRSSWPIFNAPGGSFYCAYRREATILVLRVWLRAILRLFYSKWTESVHLSRTGMNTPPGDGDSPYMDGDRRDIDAYEARYRDIDGAQDVVYLSVYLEHIQKSE